MAKKKSVDVKSNARSYRPRTVIEAQRRVLWLVYRILGEESASKRRTLRTDGIGLWTWDEVRDHCKQAAETRVKYTAR